MDNTRSEGKPTLNPQNERRLDFRLLRTIYRKRRLPFFLAVPLLFLLCAGYGLFFAPQSFSAYTSMSMQQNTPLGGAASLLTGVNNLSGGGRYLGIIKSRNFAEQVETIVHLQQIYRLKTLEDAIDELQKVVKIEDNPSDALLILRVDVRGPARFGRESPQKREAIRHLPAFIANTYVQIFRKYLRESDNDREAVLYRGAEQKLKIADASYRQSVARYLLAARGRKSGQNTITLPSLSGGSPLSLGGMSSETSPGSGSGSLRGGQSTGAGDATAVTELQSLFLKRGTLEQRIKAAEVAQTETDARLRTTPDQLTQLPAEDPLLTQARADVTDAQIRLEGLLQTYANTAPPVVAARRALEAAKARLSEQAKSIRTKVTSTAISLEASKAELETVNHQIEEASRRFERGKEVTLSLDALRGDMALALEILKTASTEAARISLQTVSSQSRMVVIDKAVQPRFGKPGIAVTLMLSALVTGAFLGIWLALEYSLALLKAGETAPSVQDGIAL